MRVKLGDFGSAINFQEGINEYAIRALTLEYSNPDICKKFQNGELATREELIKNDYYCLWKTFEKILNMFK
jgi:hypothetical protein